LQKKKKKKTGKRNNKKKCGKKILGEIVREKKTVGRKFRKIAF
jgi:hypothetical protein